MTHRVRNNTNIISMQNKMFPATEFIRARDIHVNRHHYLCVCGNGDFCCILAGLDNEYVIIYLLSWNEVVDYIMVHYGKGGSDSLYLGNNLKNYLKWSIFLIYFIPKLH